VGTHGDLAGVVAVILAVQQVEGDVLLPLVLRRGRPRRGELERRAPMTGGISPRRG
jgi:hypothetical protein